MSNSHSQPPHRLDNLSASHDTSADLPSTPTPLTVVIAGPTASGKTDLALKMADLRPGTFEIVNADSMQVYREMDIGTAKPTAAELARVPHHLIDVREPHETFTAGEFRRATLAAIDDIHAREKRAIVVGGTGFYLRALFFGIWDAPPADAEIRARLEQLPLTALHAQLLARDPESAVRIGPADRYRLMRALELIEQSGQTPTELQKQMTTPPHPGLELWIVDRDPNELLKRIHLRTGQMLEQGIVDEVRHLRARYQGQPEPRALGAVGYKEVCDYLDGRPPIGRKIAPGISGLQQEIELATRQLVKKQRTWFKNLGQKLGAQSRTLLLPDADWRAEFNRVYGATP